MTNRTWNKLRSDYYWKLLHPEEQYLIDKILLPLQKRAISFIQKLLDRGVRLDQISVNDWTVSDPKVYVNGWQYSRFSDYDVDRALRYLREDMSRLGS